MCLMSVFFRPVPQIAWISPPVELPGFAFVNSSGDVAAVGVPQDEPNASRPVSIGNHAILFQLLLKFLSPNSSNQDKVNPLSESSSSS